jgi:hypothetical protein
MSSGTGTLDSIINNAIQTAIVSNLVNMYRDRNYNFSISSRYYNNPPVGGYQLSEEHEYILPDCDDISSLIFLDIATRFGSPGSDDGSRFVEKYKEYRKKKIKGLGKYKKIKESDKLEEPCSICMDDFCCGEYQRTLECNHIFHKKCIDKWFKKDKNDGPLCRKKIIECNF